MQTLIPSTDHKGITYPSQKDMCDTYHVEQSLYKKRIARGWTVETALEGKKPYYKKNGKAYWTQKEVCEEFNISPNTFRAKLREGYTKDQIVDKEYLKRTIGPDNKKYFSEDEMCKEYGVKKSTYRKRMEKTGDKKFALTSGDQRKRSSRKCTVTCDGKTLRVDNEESDPASRKDRLQAYYDRINK